MSFSFPLPDHMLKLLDEKDRAKLGKAGLMMEEHIAQGEIKLERDLHRAIANLLRLRGIEFVESRMDRRSTNQIGTPDFLFCVWGQLTPTKTDPLAWCGAFPVACAWECKAAGRMLTEEQQAMFKRMTTAPNTWTCRVIRNVDDALAELRRLGL
jgi:hypothetical protein